jgi:hypothetical protein
MTKGKLLAVGASNAVVITRKHLRQLGWWRGDIIVQEVHDDHVLLRNMTPHTVNHVRTGLEYGDRIGDNSERSV